MDTRRDFIKKAALLSGAAGMSLIIPETIRRALAINPAPGSTYLDAEHVVIFMQENRSFDHCFGTLNGVRGFNDPRAFTLPNGNSVWAQSNQAGDTYAPFRLNLMDSKITWMGSLPHGRGDQVAAYNNGKHDRWIDSKPPWNKEYRDLPLTMGYFTREDIPFHYALADAFTICDQHFCSAMTSTWPNRLYMWGGTIREEKNASSKAYINNNVPWGEARWKTFPERLQDNGISWKIYQNDLAAGGGFDGEERAWLANYICNLMEWLSQYNVRFSDRYVRSVKNRIDELSEEIPQLEKQLLSGTIEKEKVDKLKKDIAKKKKVLSEAQKDIIKWSDANFEKLSHYQKELYRRAFTTNSGDPDFRKLTTLKYRKDGKERSLLVPKGDEFYQFRKDVDSGQLPTVSWLVAPQRYSDHPSTPWYGAWYTSEILNILIKNPEVWKKTIFILTYDENDGYFDHIPPFVAPDPRYPSLGKCSPGISNVDAEIIQYEQQVNDGVSERTARAQSGSIGLGYRVPLIIASPWSRGGKVCSQIFDHTSSLQFLEKFLAEKYNIPIKDDNITPWRRAICGDLTAAFQTYKETDRLNFLSREDHIEDIYNAQFKELPSGFKKLSTTEIESINKNALNSRLIPKQEPGTRACCALPYQIYADGRLSRDKTHFEIIMESRNEVFGDRSVGVPFYVYAQGEFLTTNKDNRKKEWQTGCNRQYAVAAGELLTDRWALHDFKDDGYHLRLHGPNGFYREFMGDDHDPQLQILFEYANTNKGSLELNGNIELKIKNRDLANSFVCSIIDNHYGRRTLVNEILPREEKSIVMDLSSSFNWYDFTLNVKGNKTFSKRYAGHVETGGEGITDPAMST